MMQDLPDPLISSNPNMLGGMACFTGVRVPVQALFDYLKSGHDLEEFLADYPSVSREHAVAALDLANRRVASTVAAGSISMTSRSSDAPA
jgi:uncharacterized protein (DUF433 family)